MRRSFLVIGLILGACTSPTTQSVSNALISADAATSLAVGERISERVAARAGSGGQDPVVNMTLSHADGRTLAFQEANHAPHDLFVQRPGGALAQIMGLPESERVLLFHAASGEGQAGAPFFCGPQGPAALGRYEAPDGLVQIVGLRQGIEVETRPDGQLEALPYSPDQVCARLRFRKG